MKAGEDVSHLNEEKALCSEQFTGTRDPWSYENGSRVTFNTHKDRPSAPQSPVVQVWASFPALSNVWIVKRIPIIFIMFGFGKNMCFLELDDSAENSHRPDSSVRLAVGKQRAQNAKWNARRRLSICHLGNKDRRTLPMQWTCWQVWHFESSVEHNSLFKMHHPGRETGVRLQAWNTGRHMQPMQTILPRPAVATRPQKQT